MNFSFLPHVPYSQVLYPSSTSNWAMDQPTHPHWPIFGKVLAFQWRVYLSADCGKCLLVFHPTFHGANVHWADSFVHHFHKWLGVKPFLLCQRMNQDPNSLQQFAPWPISYFVSQGYRHNPLKTECMTPPFGWYIVCSMQLQRNMGAQKMLAYFYHLAYFEIWR